MKLQKTFFCLVILLASFQIYFGQAKPEAALIDEFPVMSCDEFLARTDNFFTVLQNNPDSQGYIIISGANEDLKRKLVYELLMKGAIAGRNFDGSRITLIRDANVADFRIQLWQVPSGAQKPSFKETRWNFTLTESKPSKLYEIFADDICPPTSFEIIYTEYLKANPQARGNIVIYSKSLKEYNALRKKTLGLLKEISSNRLNFFRVSEDFSVNQSYIEYWLVPRKKK